VPDLSGNLGASLTSIETKCLIIEPPGISGSMTFEDTGGGTANVTGTQDLNFVIDVLIAAFNAQVIITTASSTAFSGTGTGNVGDGDTIILDVLTPPTEDLKGQPCAGCVGGNINAVPSGTVNCAAFDNTTTPPTDVSAGICPLANLPMGGDNILPFEGDPGQRTFPPINFSDLGGGQLGFALGGGPAAATGWYLVNPRALAGNGTQWAALTGVQQ
jgi:hypothetical protein